MVMLQADKLMPEHSFTLPSMKNILNQLARLRTFFHTLYLFTANDFLTFAIPTTLFAIFAALSGPILTTNTSPSTPTIFNILSALLITWSSLLIFNISNQRTPTAIEEDKINKPHRPLPSGRITTESSRRLLLIGIPLVLTLSWTLACWQETLLLFTLTWMYNDLQGCDEAWLLRNLLIACGYGLYSSAALRVMTGPQYKVTAKGFQWVLLVTLVMFVTQHICDIKDAEGDRARGRKSAPLVLGDNKVRWSVAVPLVLCSLLCPAFFGLGGASYLSTLALGGLVAGRLLVLRDLKSDMITWKLWALWTCWLFMLPLAKNPEVLVRGWQAVVRTACPGGECASLNLVAVSGVAALVEGRRLLGRPNDEVVGLGGNTTVPNILVNGVHL